MLNSAFSALPLRPVHRRGFTLIELLVVISIIALLIGILLPALGAARKTARQMASNTQLRGIHQAFFTFSQENKGFYPGLSPNVGGGKDRLSSGDMQIFYPELISTGGTYAAGNGGNARARIGIMVVNGFIPPEYAISPSETDERLVPWEVGTAFDRPNTSFALLRIGSNNTDANTNGLRREWRDNVASQVVIASDRDTSGANAGGPAVLPRESVHTEPGSGEWEGGVVWNDGHTAFEQSNFMETTAYANQTNFEDDLFGQSETPAGLDSTLNTQMKSEEPL